MQNVLERAVLGVNAGQETYLLIYLLTYLESTYLLSQSVRQRAVKRRNSAIFKMKIFIY